jgi:hypothetical protein
MTTTKLARKLYRETTRTQSFRAWARANFKQTPQNELLGKLRDVVASKAQP